MAASCTVVIVFPSSGTLILRLRASEPLLCQKGTVSRETAVSLNDVGERPMDRAESLSEEKLRRDRPTGLLDCCEGHSWYFALPVAAVAVLEWVWMEEGSAQN